MEDQDFDVFPKLKFDVRVNGKSAIFELGIQRKFAGTFTLGSTKSLHIHGDQCNDYLTVHNPEKQEITCVFSLPENKLVKFSKEEIKVVIPKESKYILDCNFEVVKGGYEICYFPVKAEYADGKKLSFEGKLELRIQTFSDCDSGKNRYTHFALTGQYFSYLSIENRKNIFEIFPRTGTQSIRMQPPAIGLPYSDEFKQKLPEDIRIKKTDTGTEWELEYKSDTYQDVKLIRRLKVHLTGLTEQSWTVINESENTLSNLHIKDEFLMLMFKAIPIDNKVLKLKAEEKIRYENISSDRITSNWLFSEEGDYTIGVTWDKDKTIDFGDWYLSMNQVIERLEPGQSKNLSSFRFYFNIFCQYRHFSNFVIGKSDVLPEISHRDFDQELKHPVVKGKELRFKYSVPELSKGKGIVKVNDCTVFSEELPEKVNSFSFKPELDEPSKVSIEFKKADVTQKSSFLMLPFKNEKVTQISDGTNLVLNNGCIEFKADMNFAPVIYSCRYKGIEWLDSTYPELGPKGWDNPWSGGYTALPMGLRMAQMLEHKHSAEFTVIIDDNNVEWTGIKISTVFSEDSHYKNMKLETFYLTLPEMPVLVQMCRVIPSRFNRGYNNRISGSVHFSNNKGNFNLSTDRTQIDSFEYDSHFSTKDLLKLSYREQDAKAYFYCLHNDVYPFVMKDIISVNCGRPYHEITPDRPLTKVLSVLFFSNLELKKDDFILFQGLEFFMKNIYS